MGFYPSFFLQGEVLSHHYCRLRFYPTFFRIQTNEITQKDPTDITGVTIWASVRKQVNPKASKQIKSATFPIRLKSEDWSSGEINWLLDGEPPCATGPSQAANAPTREPTAAVIANFKQVVKEGDLRLHPLVTRLVDQETLEKMGAKKVGESE